MSEERKVKIKLLDNSYAIELVFYLRLLRNYLALKSQNYFVQGALFLMLSISLFNQVLISTNIYIKLFDLFLAITILGFILPLIPKYLKNHKFRKQVNEDIVHFDSIIIQNNEVKK